MQGSSDDCIYPSYVDAWKRCDIKLRNDENTVSQTLPQKKSGAKHKQPIRKRTKKTNGKKSKVCLQKVKKVQKRSYKLRPRKAEVCFHFSGSESSYDDSDKDSDFHMEDEFEIDENSSFCESQTIDNSQHVYSDESILPNEEEMEETLANIKTEASDSVTDVTDEPRKKEKEQQSSDDDLDLYLKSFINKKGKKCDEQAKNESKSITVKAEQEEIFMCYLCHETFTNQYTLDKHSEAHLIPPGNVSFGKIRSDEVSSKKYWQRILQDLLKCNNYPRLEEYVRGRHLKDLEVNLKLQADAQDSPDHLSMFLWPKDAPQHMVPVTCGGEGNCLFRAISVQLFGTEEEFTQLRVRTVFDSVLNKKLYLNEETLYKGAVRRNTRVNLIDLYCMQSPSYKPDLSSEEIYEHECVRIREDKKWSGMFQIHQIANVSQRVIRLIYPEFAALIRDDMNRFIYPLKKPFPQTIHLMWTSTNNMTLILDHFVPVLKEWYTITQKKELNSLSILNISLHFMLVIN